MEKSYFKYKSKIKEKLKELNYYEKMIDKIEISPNLQNLVHTIKYLKNYVKEIKEEIKIDIDIICHG